MAKGDLHGAIPQALPLRRREPVQPGTIFLHDQCPAGLFLGNSGFAGLHGLFIAFAVGGVNLESFMNRQRRRAGERADERLIGGILLRRRAARGTGEFLTRRSFVGDTGLICH